MRRLRCWLRRRHEWAYRATSGGRVFWISLEHLNRMRDETTNPRDQHPLRSGEIGHFYGIPLYKTCRGCGERAA